MSRLTTAINTKHVDVCEVLSSSSVYDELELALDCMEDYTDCPNHVLFKTLKEALDE